MYSWVPEGWLRLLMRLGQSLDWALVSEQESLVHQLERVEAVDLAEALVVRGAGPSWSGGGKALCPEWCEKCIVLANTIVEREGTTFDEVLKDVPARSLIH
jgi:hypothetical protein